MIKHPVFSIRLFTLTVLLVLAAIRTGAREQTTEIIIGKAFAKAGLETRADDGSILKLDLETALAVAITNNFELKTIKTMEHIRRLAIREQWRNFFPTLTLSYQQIEESRIREVDSREHRLTANAGLVIYDGGERRLELRVAKLQAILARNDYRIALNRFMSEIYNAHMTLLKLKEAIEIYRKTLYHGTLQLKFITRELELGEATKFDKLEIEAKVKEIELNLEQVKDNYEKALNEYKLMLRIDYRTQIEPVGNIQRDFKFNYLEKKNHSLEQCIALARKNRKEIESADVEYDISRHRYRIAKYYYFPKFTLNGSYTLSDEYFFPREKGWGVSLEVSTKLWGNTLEGKSGYNEDYNGNSRTLSNSGALSVLNDPSFKRRIKESELEMLSTADEKKIIRQTVATEITTAYRSVHSAWNMIDIADKQLELYDSQLVIERLKADLGESRRYDLIKKEIERGEAALAYLDSMVRYLSVTTTLELAMGVDIGFLKLTSFKKNEQNKKSEELP